MDPDESRGNEHRDNADGYDFTDDFSFVGMVDPSYQVGTIQGMDDTFDYDYHDADNPAGWQQFQQLEGHGLAEDVPLGSDNPEPPQSERPQTLDDGLRSSARDARGTRSGHFEPDTQRCAEV